MADVPEPITEEEQSDYLQSAGACCPKCRSNQIQAERPEYSDGDPAAIYASVRCFNPICLYEWVDYFRLTGVEAAEEFTHKENEDDAPTNPEG